MCVSPWGALFLFWGLSVRSERPSTAMSSRHHNPERRAFKGRSYNKGGERVSVLREKLEIKVGSAWAEVDEWIFRSWSGSRRVNGEDFSGPVYFLGSDKVAS